MTLSFRNSGEVARLFAPSYAVREFKVILYDKSFRRLTSEAEKTNMRVAYGGFASPKLRFGFVVPGAPGAEFFTVTCASLSKGTDNAVSIKIGNAARYGDIDRSALGFLPNLDISEDQIETLERDSGCKLSSSTIDFR